MLAELISYKEIDITLNVDILGNLDIAKCFFGLVI